jgi:hypothetical protein
MEGTDRERTSHARLGRPFAAAAAALLLLVAGPVTGQDGDQSACQAQAKRLCSNLSTEAAQDRCILQRELECEDSGPSSLVRQRVQDPTAGMRNACRADFGRVCSDLGGDASRPAIIRCLREHTNEISDPCRMALSLEAEATSRPAYEECRTQIRKVCPGAIGREALRECLRSNGDALDEDCQRVLTRRAAGGDGGDGLTPPPRVGRGQP